VLEYCAKSELDPRSGFGVLKGRHTNRCRTRLQHGARTGFFRPFSIPNPACGCNSDRGQYSNAPLPNPTYRARLVRRSHRSMMDAAQGRPRKRGALHNKGSGEGGSTRTIWMPLQHPKPATRVQFGLGAVLQHSRTPSLRAARFEDEDENEAPCEGGS
jgi:hypothetical protein